MDETLEHFACGLAAYRAADWNAAAQHFDAALKANPDDKPSLIFQKRTAHFMKEPPGEEWDGVWTLKEK